MTQTPSNLWALTRGQRLRYGGTAASLALSNLLLFAAPLLAKSAIDVSVSGSLEAVPRWLTGLAVWLGTPLSGLRQYLFGCGVLSVLSAALGGVCHFLAGRLSASASEAIIKQQRDELYRRLHHLHASFYDEADTGDLVQRCSSDVETVRTFLASDIVEIGRASLLVLSVTPILFAMDAQLGLIAFALLPLIIGSAVYFFARVKRQFGNADEAEAELTGVLQENLTGVRVVRAFARQEHEIERFARKNAQFRRESLRVAHLMSIYTASSDFVCVVELGLVLLLGAQRVLHGDISVGTLFAFTTCVTVVIWPVRQLGRILTDSGKAVVSLARLREILNAPEESREQAPIAERAAGAIELEHVTFGYDPARPVLHDLSVRIRAGETLAIIGPPGSGKSTLVRLLLRLYKPQAGCVRIDGQDISQVSRSWLRRQLGVVLQDPFLYSRSIEANLRVGRNDASSELLVQASQAAALHRTIESFERGYHTLIGERGVTLSGGQRQRLALARALVRDPPLLVLDDSLSAIDTDTESKILRALRARHRRHTTLIIAHRLSSIMHADRILVLDRGRCVQLGSHAELAQVEGPYRRLLQIQRELDAEIERELLTADASADAATAPPIRQPSLSAAGE